jgi:aminoglycoside 2'-N-acetyltransferase I
MLRTAPTADLGAATLRAVRSLMDDAFGGEFSDDDWDHLLGGVHVLAVEGDAVVGHAAVVRRQLIHGGRTLRCGYVEGVAVRADRRRRGLGKALMEEAGRIVRGGYDVGALSGTEAGMPLYERLGWQRWRGPLSALTPQGVERTPDDDDSVHVLPASADLDPDGELTCDWRAGEVW